MSVAPAAKSKARCKPLAKALDQAWEKRPAGHVGRLMSGQML